MSVPTDRKYAESHEWVKMDGGKAIIGLTKFAVDQLTDITFLELPKPGTKISAGTPCGVVESVKAANDVFSPISGVVEEFNQAAVDDPSLLNRDAHEAGWLIKAKATNPKEFDNLLDPAAYEKLIGH